MVDIEWKARKNNDVNVVRNKSQQDSFDAFNLLHSSRRILSIDRSPLLLFLSSFFLTKAVAVG